MCQQVYYYWMIGLIIINNDICKIVSCSIIKCGSNNKQFEYYRWLLYNES